MSDKPETTWIKRVAAEICRAETLTPGMAEALLEAAGEIRCAQLKMMLGRCQEVIEAFSSEDCQQSLPEMVDQIRKVLR